MTQSDPSTQGIRRDLNRYMENGDGAPDDQHHHHPRRYSHDLHGFAAGFVDALGVLPPEINGDDHGKGCREGIRRKIVEWMTCVVRHFLDKSGEVLPGYYGADRTG